MVREINLNHICKIEGHADLSLKIDKNIVTSCELKANEGARFFEALVREKKVEDIQEIVSRICGICSSAHSICSIQALEEALGIKASNQQKMIRELLNIGERLRSNATHLYFLSLPDYYNVASALQLGPKHQEKINTALRLIRTGNHIIEKFGGRELHPFLSIKKDLKVQNFDYLLEDLENSKIDIIKTIKLFKSLDYPNFVRECDYLCLREETDYASISGKVVSTSGLIDDDEYKKHLSENIKEYATSKYVLQEGKPYMLGAMARINKNHDKLDQETKNMIKGLKIPFNNPYHNTIAQALEMLHLTNKTIKMIKSFDFEPDSKDLTIKEGHGVSAVEAPRGTLFHEYKIDKSGKITYCNIITPTAQNLNMMEKDITMLVNKDLKDKRSRQQIIDDVEKLIRAYDPCFSCSTHFLRVKWL